MLRQKILISSRPTKKFMARFTARFTARLAFCFIVDLPADSFFIAKADFFECGGEEGGGACVSCSVLIVITPAQNLEFLIL